MKWLVTLSMLSLIVAACSGPAPGEKPAPFELKQVATGLERPLSLVAAPDGSGRLFLLEQAGRVLIMKDGDMLNEPFLDLSALVNRSGNEQGLLSLAFDPGFSTNGRVYVHYSGRGGETVVARYLIDTANPDRLNPDSAQVILTVEQPYSNHNGGPLLFGPDGYLYLALGDGGSGGDPQNLAQNLDVMLGKILRLDVSQGDGYTIPPDNPFVGKPGLDEIWAYGLRNPWRVSFDRETGDLWIADVGQNEVEEINLQPASSTGGENYGWKIYEGTRRYDASQTIDNHVPPIHEYTHRSVGGCSVTGGYVYRGQALPALAGTYIFGDFCSGQIWGLKRSGDAWLREDLVKTSFRISSFGQDADGELYVIDHAGGVYRFEPRQ